MRRAVWLLGVLPNALALALVGLGLAGGHLDPGPFWFAAMAAVALPYATLLLALTALPALLARRWGWVAANALVLVLALARVLPAERLAARPAPGPGDLVLMTFNVPRHGETAEGLARDVYDLVRAEEPDLVALQGPTTWRVAGRTRTAAVADYVRPILDSLGFALSVPADLPRGGLPQPVLTRRESGLEAVETARTSSLGEHVHGRASLYVRARIAWDGREAVLYNIHLRGFGPEKPWGEEHFPWLRPAEWRPFLRRYRQAYRLRAQEVRALRARVEAEELPVILAGDFNATPYNWEFRQLARGRIDAFRARGRGWGGTYRSDLPLVRIDHVLADPAFEVVAAHVPDVRFSDHRPLVVRLRWREPR